MNGKNGKMKKVNSRRDKPSLKQNVEDEVDRKLKGKGALVSHQLQKIG